MDNIEGKESMGWSRFVELLLYRFVAANGENLVGELTNLGNTVQWMSMFISLMS